MVEVTRHRNSTRRNCYQDGDRRVRSERRMKVKRLQPPPRRHPCWFSRKLPASVKQRQRALVEIRRRPHHAHLRDRLMIIQFLWNSKGPARIHFGPSSVQGLLPPFSPIRFHWPLFSPIMRPPSYRQRLFVEYDLGGSSGSAVDAARRAGYPWTEQMSRKLSRKVREMRSSGGPQGHEGGRGHPLSSVREAWLASNVPLATVLPLHAPCRQPEIGFVLLARFRLELS